MDFFALKLKQFISRGGGSIIFGKTDLKTLELDTPFVEGTIETTGLKIGDIYFLQIYRPPSGNKDNFVEILSTYLDTLGGRKLVIGGDFNLNSSVKNKWLEKLCNNYNLTIQIKEPTRLDSGTCIDNFLTNIKGIFSVSTVAISDHQAIIASVLSNNIERTKPTKHFYREMKELNWQIFKNELHKTTVHGDGIQDKWNNFLGTIKEIVEVSFPQKSTKQVYFFEMSQGLLKSRDK